MLKKIMNYRYIKAILLVLTVFVVALVIRGGKNTETVVIKEDVKPLVTVTTPLEYTDAGTLSLIGTVRAFTEAQITAEVGGRVTSVNITLGQKVQAGTILVTIENANERASLLQAEGSYEAAEAAAATGNVGTKEAEIRLADSLLGLAAASDAAYGASQNVLLGTLDTQFSNPNGSYPGLRIATAVDNSFLRSERIDFQTILPSWQALDFSTDDISLQKSNTDFVIKQIKRLINISDIFITAVNSRNNSDSFTKDQKEQLNINFTTARSQLVTAQGNMESKFAALESAKQNLDRATINATGGATSAASAQLKQALGSLRAAQANLAKTILRTPISGTVNSLTIQSGDFIASFQNVAIIANNSALEIVTFVGDIERDALSVGDKVLIENNYEGTVTQIAPAVDSVTRKTEVRIATENSNIKNGDTVKITDSKENATTTLKDIRVPLTAVKFEIEDGSIFMVREGKLESVPVKLGNISGNSVVVLEGLSANDEFVVDARGLLSGALVEVKK